MPNGTPFNTGFKNLHTEVCNLQTACSPIQTVATTSDWYFFRTDQLNLAQGVNLNQAAIKTDGTLWTWGPNGFGQLGNNNNLNQSSPVQTVSDDNNWKQVGATCINTIATKTDGTLWVWGLNSNGQLGTSNTISQSSPVQTVSVSTDWNQVASSSRGFSAAIKTDGTLWLWGAGTAGSLGNDSTIAQSSPVQTVSTSTNWKQVSLGSGSAAIKTDGTLWLWGCNNYGRVGNNNTINRSSPVQTVSTGTNWIWVTSGINAVGSIKTDGTLWLWGANYNALLGNGTADRSSPVQTVSTGTNWKQVSIGCGHTSAVKTDGTLWLWGFSFDGQLGNNKATGCIGSPVQTVSTGANWKETNAGLYINSATKCDGTLWLWGRNTNGSIGNNSSVPLYISSPVQTVSTGTNWASTEESIWCSFSGGCQNSAAIKSDGTLWLWGCGTFGSLGNNSFVNHSSPVQTVSTGTNWKQICFGVGNSAAIKTDGTLWLWGNAAFGKLGNCSTINRSSPVQTVSTGNDWKQVGLGSSHSAAIKTDGTLWLWGRNHCGQLSDYSAAVLAQSSPVQTVSQGTNWKQVALGGYHSVAIKTDGTLWTWGGAGAGPLGNNCTINRSSPVQTVSTGTNWKQVSSSVVFSTVGAIKTDGTLWAWGYNRCGRLGNNNTLNQSSPVQTVSTGTNWKQVSVGGSHVTTVKTDGTLWSWGQNQYGQLALGFLGRGGTVLSGGFSVPIQSLSQSTNWRQVAAGYQHSLAINDDNELYVWGDNSVGQLAQPPSSNNTVLIDLGNVLLEKEYLLDVYPNLVPWMKAPALWGAGFNTYGTLGTFDTARRSSPVQTISSGTIWKEVSTTNPHTAAVKTDGTLWVWGCNAFGNLGNNRQGVCHSSPIQTISTGTDWKQVSVGTTNSGSMAAVKTDGTLWMWGAGLNGVLGNNFANDRSSPVQTVSQGTNWKQVSVGQCHAAAIKTDGTLWLWGYSGSGRLGNFNTITRSSPVQTVSTGTNWKQVSVGGFTSGAIKTDGTLWMWGGVGVGILGTNNSLTHSSPVQTVSTGTNWKQVSLGYCHTSAIKTDGTLWLWGSAVIGQLGTNSSTNRSSPVQTVSQGNNWKIVSSGGCQTAAIKTDGTLWVWGDNLSGNLMTNDIVIRSYPVQTVSQGTNWKDVSSGTSTIFAIREDGDW